MKRGFISNEQKATRALAHGQITDLTDGFKLKGGSPFTLVIIPKANISDRLISAPENSGLLVNCTLFEDDFAGDHPVMFNWPSEGLFYEISADAIALDTYDVFWSCGNEDEPFVYPGD